MGDDHSSPGTAFRVVIEGEPRAVACRADQSVVDAMRANMTGGLAFSCRSGGCGLCRVRIIEGRYETRPMSAACVTPDEARAGYALACRVLPRSDLRLVPAVRCRDAAAKALAA